MSWASSLETNQELGGKVQSLRQFARVAQRRVPRARLQVPRNAEEIMDERGVNVTADRGILQDQEKKEAGGRSRGAAAEKGRWTCSGYIV